MRWEIDPSHAHQAGIPEDMSLDQTTHSLFGVSKVAADVMVQEYGPHASSIAGGSLRAPLRSYCAISLAGSVTTRNSLVRRCSLRRP